MKLRSLSLIPIALAVTAALVLASSGASKPSRALLDPGQCGTAPCWTSFTVNGGAPPTGVTLSLTVQVNTIQISVKNNNATELSPKLSANDTIHAVLNLGGFDPVVFGTTGLVTSYAESTGATNTVTFDVKPRSSSWKLSGCTVVNCGSDANPVTASNDFTSVVLGFITDLTNSGASAATKNAMRGTWFDTNAQSMTLPSFNVSNNSVSFTVAAPHFKTDGTTVNTGFFDFFAPDTLVQSLGIADPSSVTTGSFDIASSNNVSTSFSVTHQSSPAGVLINAPSFNYSSPTYTVAKSSVKPDTTAPTFENVPSGLTAEATGPGGATVSFAFPSALDDRDGERGVGCSSYSGELFPIGATTVTCTASDTSGNYASASFTVTVTDTTAPTLSLPSGPTAEATSPAGAMVTYSTSSSDIVDGAVPVTCAPASGSTFHVGSTSVSCSAVDAHGNTATSSFTVSVQDTVAPQLTVPKAVSVKAKHAIRVSFPTAARDAVSGKVAVHCTPASGSLFKPGATKVTCSAVDDAGNRATKTFTVTVKH
jgi:hypothetical protein